MFKLEKLIIGDLGWGDEFFIATLMTIAVSICSMGLGVFISIFAAWAKLTKSRTLNFISSFYTTVIRGIPELLVIYLIFFGGSAAVMKLAKVFGYDGYIEINAVITGVSMANGSTTMEANGVEIPLDKIETVRKASG